jgi:ribose 5-phosphate isomerase B
MRIAIGADHAGFALKQRLLSMLRDLGHDIEDFGTHDENPVDYPPICAEVARAVVAGRADRGIALGGTAQGEPNAATTVAGSLAALCTDIYTARLSRSHNDANVLSIGGRIVAPELAREIVTVWLSTPFEGGRHQRRIDQLLELDRERARI